MESIGRIFGDFIFGYHRFAGDDCTDATVDVINFSTHHAQSVLTSIFPLGHQILTGNKQQGRIHGNPVADGWAGAVMRKPLGIQKCDVPTYLPTDTASSRVACPRLKKVIDRQTEKRLQPFLS